MVTFDCCSNSKPPKLYIQSPNGEIGELGVINDIDLSVDEVQAPYTDTKDYILNSDTKTASIDIQNKEEVEELLRLIKEKLCLKEDDGSLAKVCDVKDINPVTPRLISDNDNSIDVDYADFIFKTQEIYSIKGKIDDINKTFADWLSKTIYSYKVICTTKKFQKRRHHKYRINKKWAKRYGYTYVEVQNEPIIFMDGTIYCTKDGLDQIKKTCK